MKKVKKIGSFSFLSAKVNVSSKELLELSNEILKKMGSGVITLSTSEEGSCKLLVRVSDDLITKGIHANKLIQKVAALIEGSGGGRKESAQAGGKNSKGVIIAFEEIQHLLENEQNDTK